MVIVFVLSKKSAEIKSEEKATLESESGLFLTLRSGTSGAQNENLRPLINTSIPLISGKYDPNKPLLVFS